MCWDAYKGPIYCLVLLWENKPRVLTEGIKADTWMDGTGG